MQKYRVGAIEKLLGGRFEIGGGGIENGQVEIGLQETQNAVGFDDGVLCFSQNRTHAGHGFGEASLLGANPPGVSGSGNEEARTVGFARPIALFVDSPGMVSGGAVAWSAVGRADAVSVLSDFERGPVKRGQGGDEAGDDAGFSDAAGVSADDEDGHGKTGYRATGSRLQAFGARAPEFILVDGG